MVETGERIIFDRKLPPGNRLLNLWLKTLHIPFIGRRLFLPLTPRFLPHCEKVGVSPGFFCLYGNIYAKDVFLSDTFILDYAPVFIGEGARFSFQNMILTSTHDLRDFGKVIACPVRIGANVWVTSRCLITSGVSIGDYSVIGAGSVVSRDIPAGVFAAGNPAKVVRELRPEERVSRKVRDVPSSKIAEE